MNVVQGKTLEGLGVRQRHVGSGASEAGRGDGGSSVAEESILGIIPDAGDAKEAGAAIKCAGGG